MSDLTLTARLNDQVSGPAKAGASALKDEASAAKQVDAALRKIDTGLSKGLAGAGAGAGVSSGLADAGKSLKGFQVIADGLSRLPLFGRLIGDADKFGGSLSKIFGGKGGLGFDFGNLLGGAATKLEGMGIDPTAAMGAVAGGAAAAAAAVAALGVALGVIVFKLGELTAKASLAFASFAVKTAAFRESSLLAFETMLRSKEKADEVYASAVKVAAATPLETTQVIESYTKLLAGGFKANELERYMTSIADFTSALGAEKLDQVVRAFSRIRTEGKMTGEAVQMLADAGLPLEELAKKLGKKQVKDIYGTDAAKALPALLSVIDDRFGRLSERGSKGLAGLWSSLSSKPFELFSAALGKEGGGLNRFIDVLKEGMGELLNKLDGSLGQGIVSAINGIGGAFAAIATVLKGLGSGFLAGLDKGLRDSGAIDQMDKASKLSLKDLASGAAALGASLGVIAGYAVMVVFALQAVGAFATEHSTTLQVIGVVLLVVAGAFAILAVAITVLVVVLAVLLLPVWLALVAIATVVAVVFLVVAAAVGAIVTGLIWLASMLWDAAVAVTEFIGALQDAGDPVALVEGLSKLNSIIPDAISSAFRAALGVAIDAAKQIGNQAATAFTDAFKPSIDLSAMSMGFGGMGAPNYASPYGNLTLTAPSGAFPSTSSMPQQALAREGGGRGDQNVNIAVSGVGKTDEELAWMIKSKVAEEMKKAAGV